MLVSPAALSSTTLLTYLNKRHPQLYNIMLNPLTEMAQIEKQASRLCEQLGVEKQWTKDSRLRCPPYIWALLVDNPQLLSDH
jgi:hypothetical protein